MLRMKNWKLQLNLKMLKDELDEQRAPEKSGYPATSPLVAGEPFIRLQETTQIKETREVVVQATHFMLIDEATQTETEQEPAEDRGVTTGHDTSEKKEEEGEVDCSVSDLHGHPDFSNPE
jgi:hypothetical protein